MLDPFQLPFVQRGLIEILLLAVGAGLLGTWIVLRGLAFYAHAVGTAAFPGLVLADGIGFAAPLGAFGAALVFAAAVALLLRPRFASTDTATALALSGSLALGVILASDVFGSGSSVESLLFGSLLVVEPRDQVLAAVTSALALGASVTLGRAWLATGFDAEGARALGVRSQVHDAVLLGLIALGVIAALSSLGALLAAALLVIPAATVRLVVRRLRTWQLGTIALVVLEGIAGLWLSVETDAPPGATIAVLSGGLFAIVALVRFLAGRLGRAPALAVFVICLLPGAIGCGGEDDRDSAVVVATTTQVADWARAIGGPGFEVRQLLRPNTDPHDYEPRPSDVEAVATADLVIASGGEVDAWADDLVQKAGGDASLVRLDEGLEPRLGTTGVDQVRDDPHWWHDPRKVAAAVPVIRDALGAARPSARARLARNARRYSAQLRELDARIAACTSRIPRSERKLVTDHEAFSHFARRYGFEVVGAVIPARVTGAQPSARDVARLIAAIEREHVRAVYSESSLSPRLARSIARQTGANAELTLYGDSLGPPGSDGETYLEMEIANADAIARGLSGGRISCAGAAG